MSRVSDAILVGLRGWVNEGRGGKGNIDQGRCDCAAFRILGGLGVVDVIV